MTESGKIFTAYLMLVALLLATFACAWLDLGRMHVPLAMVFSLSKTLLILYAFMNFGSTYELSRIYFMVGVFTLAVLILGVLDDVVFREIQVPS